MAQAVKVAKTQPYVELLIQSSGLQILQEGRANRAKKAKENKELALFHLFFKKEFLEVICTWLNKRLREKTSSKHHYSQVSKREFDAIWGLEMGMSVLQFNNVRSYWADGKFLGHPTFYETMSRNRFQTICRYMTFYNPDGEGGYQHKTVSKDPLWHSRTLWSTLQGIAQNWQSQPVPAPLTKTQQRQRQGQRQKHIYLL